MNHLAAARSGCLPGSTSPSPCSNRPLSNEPRAGRESFHNGRIDQRPGVAYQGPAQVQACNTRFIKECSCRLRPVWARAPYTLPSLTTVPLPRGLGDPDRVLRSTRRSHETWNQLGNELPQPDEPLTTWPEPTRFKGPHGASILLFEIVGTHRSKRPRTIVQADPASRWPGPTSGGRP